MRAAFTLIRLYIPDLPLDPAVEQECTDRLLHQEALRYSAVRTVQLAKVSPVESGMIEAGKSHASHQAGHYTQRAILVPSFYAETQRYLSAIQSLQQMCVIETDLLEERRDGREAYKNFQAASLAFIRRLETGFKPLGDLVLPVVTAIRAIRLGLAMTARKAESVAARKNAPLAISTVEYLSSFPARSQANSLTGLQLSAAHDISADSGSQALLALQTCAYLFSGGSPTSTIHDRVDRSYQALISLWMADQSSAQRAEQVAQSLYRAKTTEFSDLPDAEQEARELLELFPQYDDESGEDPAIDGHGEKKSGNITLLDWPQILKTYTLHLYLFGGQVPKSYTAEYETDRIGTLASILASQPTSFDDQLDLATRPLQLAILHRQHVEWTSTAMAAYNFYKSANIQQVARALNLVQRLQQRLRDISLEFPDQMVLQHLLDRCQNICSISASSPLARILSALEQLLAHTEDWQAYANRENSVKQYQEEIIALIISWRKLELAGWSTVLQQEVQSYTEDTAEWWFRLYQLLVVGNVDSVSNVEGKDGAVDTHLKQSLPLLREFMEGSSLGHFAPRLDLLRSFAKYLSHTPNLSTATNPRVRCLESLCRRYGQFSAAVEAAISRQRAPIDKSVADFIKLASWKDTNMEAMRASARKTHGQLYKAIRKMREILRQPVASVLGQPLSVPQVQATTSVGVPSAFLVEERIDWPSISEADSQAPTYIVNLPQTYNKYSAVLQRPDAMPLTEGGAVTISDLIETIAETATSLRRETPATLTADNKKQVANLQTRKRKAFADLLKALRGMGFSANTPADQLARQSSVAWLCDLPGMADLTDVKLSALSSLRQTQHHIDIYHHQLDLVLPAMRSALLGHSEDLVSQDVQRSFGFVENVFATALRTRMGQVDLNSALRLC